MIKNTKLKRSEIIVKGRNDYIWEISNNGDDVYMRCKVNHDNNTASFYDPYYGEERICCLTKEMWGIKIPDGVGYTLFLLDNYGYERVFVTDMSDIINKCNIYDLKDEEQI